jgi:hypothetical protein
MPFANNGRLIASFLQVFGNIRLITIKIVIQGKNTIFMTILARQDTGPAGCANRICTKGPIQPNSFLSYTINIGSTD